MNWNCIIQAILLDNSNMTNLYVRNSNTTLIFRGSLVNGVRAWRHFVMGCIGASFCLSMKNSKLQTTIAFFHWYAGTNTIVPSYNPKLSCLKLIIERFERLIKESIGRRPSHATKIQEYMHNGHAH